MSDRGNPDANDDVEWVEYTHIEDGPPTLYGVDSGKKLLGTTNAEAWAHEFCRQFNGWIIAPEARLQPDPRLVLDEATMLTWFACAIETGRDAGRKETCSHTWGQLDEGLWHCVVCGELNETLNS